MVCTKVVMYWIGHVPKSAKTDKIVCRNGHTEMDMCQSDPNPISHIGIEIGILGVGRYSPVLGGTGYRAILLLALMANTDTVQLM